MRRIAKLLRPAILFVVAFALASTPHEAAHAVLARLLGFHGVLYQLWVDPDGAAASSWQIAIIAAGGPVFSLGLGCACGLIYFRSFRWRPAGLLLLLIAMVGVYTFLGPVAGAALGGDFHTALQALGASRGVQIPISGGGFLALAFVMFLAGRELRRWAPPEEGSIVAVLSSTILPATLGPLLLLVLYWPLPPALASNLFTDSVFWVFAVAGAAAAGRTRDEPASAVPFVALDAVWLAAAIAMVRIVAADIRF